MKTKINAYTSNKVSKVETQTQQISKCLTNVNIAIPNIDNPYARVDFRNQTPNNNDIVQFQTFVSDGTDLNQFTINNDFTQVILQRGIYHLDYQINVTSDAVNNVQFNILNTRETIPNLYSRITIANEIITISGSYNIEVLEDGTTFSLQNLSGVAITINDGQINFIKLKNSVDGLILQGGN